MTDCHRQRHWSRPPLPDHTVLTTLACVPPHPPAARTHDRGPPEETTIPVVLKEERDSMSSVATFRGAVELSWGGRRDDAVENGISS